jgi:hypothetical protein
MTPVPKIKGPTESHDFHDSSLIDFKVSPKLDTVSIVVSTPDETLTERLWLIECKGVLRLEYETLGTGFTTNNIPLEIYDIYNDHSSDERRRWIERLTLLKVNLGEAKNLFHIVLASSFIRGWGKNENTEGISILCRDVMIIQAPAKYQLLKYSQPRIEADNPLGV